MSDLAMKFMLDFVMNVIIGLLHAMTFIVASD